jgi:hypothetical protein
MQCAWRSCDLLTVWSDDAWFLGRRRRRSYLDTAHDTNSSASIAQSTDSASDMNSGSTSTSIRPSSSRGIESRVLTRNTVAQPTANTAELAPIRANSGNGSVHDSVVDAYDESGNDCDDALSIALAQSRLR